MFKEPTAVELDAVGFPMPLCGRLYVQSQDFPSGKSGYMCSKKKPTVVDSNTVGFPKSCAVVCIYRACIPQVVSLVVYVQRAVVDSDTVVSEKSCVVVCIPQVVSLVVYVQRAVVDSDTVVSEKSCVVVCIYKTWIPQIVSLVACAQPVVVDSDTLGFPMTCLVAFAYRACSRGGIEREEGQDAVRRLSGGDRGARQSHRLQEDG